MICMAVCPSPITIDTFQDAWKYIARKRRWSMKKELIRRVSVSLAQMVYFFVFMILALGIFYEMCGPLVRRYMDQLPQVGIWWKQISEPVLAGYAYSTLCRGSVSSAFLRRSSSGNTDYPVVPPPYSKTNRGYQTGCLAASRLC